MTDRRTDYWNDEVIALPMDFNEEGTVHDGPSSRTPAPLEIHALTQELTKRAFRVQQLASEVHERLFGERPHATNGAPDKELEPVGYIDALRREIELQGAALAHANDDLGFILAEFGGERERPVAVTGDGGIRNAVMRATR